MTYILKSKAKAPSRRSAGLLIIVGVFTSAVVVGGGALVARSVGSLSEETVTACVNRETKVVRIRAICGENSREIKLSRGGESGITEMSVCDGPDAGTVANELCKIGMTGPGGGPVFFIDDQDRFASFCASGDCNYLEASPADVDEADSDFLSAWCSDSTTDLGLTGWDKSAIGAGRLNTSTADTTCSSGAVQTAVDYTAPSFNGIAKDDWWLPSVGESMVMYANLRQAGAGTLSSDYYWTSTELSATQAWVQGFNYGDQGGGSKSNQNRKVRPVRGF